MPHTSSHGRHRRIRHHAAPDQASTLRSRLARTLRRLAAKGALYWTIVVLTILLGAGIGYYAETHDRLLAPRYWIYQNLSSRLWWKQHAEHTALVLVGDREFWGDLAGRRPISRAYLAKLIRAIDAADPLLIAIDFDLALPGSPEDGELLRAIDEISTRRPVVLPATLQEADKDLFLYALRPQIYSQHRFAGAVRTGHIQIFEDIRSIPVGLRLADRQGQDSFAEAIVRLVDRRALADFTDDEEQPFAAFFPRREFVVTDASSVLAGRHRGPLGKLRSRIVIVSGDWDERAIGRGHVDDQPTPIGPLAGSLVQANYVEALLGGAFRELPHPEALAIEFVLSGALAVLLALRKGKWWTIAWLCAAFVLVGFLLLALLGRYYDFFFPLVLLAVHEPAIEKWQELLRWLKIGKRKEA